MVLRNARRWLKDSHHTYSTVVPSCLPTISAKSMYKPLSGPSDLLKGRLSGSEHTRKGSAAKAQDDVKAAKTKADRRTRVELILSLNIEKDSVKNKVMTLKKLFKHSVLKVNPLDAKTPPLRAVSRSQLRSVQSKHKQGAAFRAGSNHFFTQSA